MLLRTSFVLFICLSLLNETLTFIIMHSSLLINFCHISFRLLSFPSVEYILCKKFVETFLKKIKHNIWICIWIYGFQKVFQMTTHFSFLDSLSLIIHLVYIVWCSTMWCKRYAIMYEEHTSSVCIRKGYTYYTYCATQFGYICNSLTYTLSYTLFYVL